MEQQQIGTAGLENVKRRRNPGAVMRGNILFVETRLMGIVQDSVANQFGSQSRRRLGNAVRRIGEIIVQGDRSSSARPVNGGSAVALLMQAVIEGWDSNHIAFILIAFHPD